METSIGKGTELIEKVITDDLRRHSRQQGIRVSHHLVQPWFVETTFVNVIALGRRHDAAEGSAASSQ
jgi:hypothetical protein